MRVLVLVLLLLWPSAVIASDEPAVGPTPQWVEPVSVDMAEAPTGAAPFRFVLFDNQFRFDADGRLNVYVRTMVAIDTQTALMAMGHAIVMWEPIRQDVTVHAVNIRRGDEVIDVLATQTFEVMRREQNLESAMLDGILTATVQPNDLRIGDVLEVAWTVSMDVPAPGALPEHLMRLELPFSLEQARVRGSWPKNLPVRTRFSDDLTAPRQTVIGDHSVFDMDLRDLTATQIETDTPYRFRITRAFEFSAYEDWAAVSRAFAPAYQTAATLEPDSPLRAEIDRIRREHDTPQAQALAALTLVQREVRYLALMMGRGNLEPASADDTWRRRLGDCKAKSALLLAILRELGIAAEPVFVSATMGDGLDQRLPMIGLFDHVVVRARIEGQDYWLDGTRFSDRSLPTAPAIDFVWGLPATAEGSDLVPAKAGPPTEPFTDTILTLDLTSGIHARAPFTGEMVFRGDTAMMMSGMGMTPDGYDQVAEAGWNVTLDDVEIENTEVRADPSGTELRLITTGTAIAPWSSRKLTVPNQNLELYAMTRDDDADKSLPIAIDHPARVRAETVIRLPQDGAFILESEDIDRTIIGSHVTRQTSLTDGVLRAVTEMTSVASEMDYATFAEEAKAIPALRRQTISLVAPAGYTPTEADLAALNAELSDSRAYVRRGAERMAAGDMEAAEADFTRAIELAPESANPYANRALARFYRKDREGADADLETAFDLDPSERIAMNARAMIALEDNDLEEALIELSRALRQAPNDVWALGARAGVYAAMGDLERALRDASRLREKNPDHDASRALEINLLDQQGQADKAMGLAEAWFEAAPQSGARDLLIDLKLSNGDAAGALAMIEAAMAEAPEDEMLNLQRGEARLATGDEAGAAADFAVVREAFSDSASVLNNLCWAGATAGRLLEQALADCDAALVIESDAMSIQDSRALVLLQMGRVDEALAAYEAVVEAAPRQLPSLYGRGLARIADGQEEEGRADIARAVATNPTVEREFRAYEARVKGEATP